MFVCNFLIVLYLDSFISFAQDILFECVYYFFVYNVSFF